MLKYMDSIPIIYKQHDASPKHVYALPTNMHFGDTWCNINYLITLSHHLGIHTLVHPGTDLNRRMFNYFSEGTLTFIEFTSKKPTHYFDQDRAIEHLEAILKLPYHHTKYPHKRERSIIAYAFDANFERENKRPPYVDHIIPTLQNDYRDISFVELGVTIGLDSTMSHLANDIGIICVDSGVAHLARSVGTPMIMIQHNWPLERGFPNSVCKYKTAHQMSDINDEVERWVRERSRKDYQDNRG